MDADVFFWGGGGGRLVAGCVHGWGAAVVVGGLGRPGRKQAWRRPPLYSVGCWRLSTRWRGHERARASPVVETTANKRMQPIAMMMKVYYRRRRPQAQRGQHLKAPSGRTDPPSPSPATHPPPPPPPPPPPASARRPRAARRAPEQQRRRPTQQPGVPRAHTHATTKTQKQTQTRHKKNQTSPSRPTPQPGHARGEEEHKVAEQRNRKRAAKKGSPQAKRVEIRREGVQRRTPVETKEETRGKKK